jgi:N-acyl-D-amino-acid deacylase
MGVTSIVTGNCGGSQLRVGKFLTDIDRRVSLNVATLIGHNTVRTEAMGGNFDRAPTADEMDKMCSFVRNGMQDGAVGLSTGLIYLPGTFSKTEEIVALAKVAAEFKGIYASHMRNEGTDLLKSLDELFRIARDAKIAAEISHIKCSGKPAWGMADQAIAAIEKARAEGLDITQDQYLYTASSTGLSTVIPASAREGDLDSFKRRMADPSQKAAIVAEMKESLAKGMRTSYDYAVIASYRKNPRLQGKNVVEAAQIARRGDSLDDQIELILDIHAQGGAGAIFHGMDEADLQKFLAHPNTMIASDAGARRFGEAFPHPRGYGNNVRCLARYVRELKLLRLEDAIRRMTSLPADTFKIKDRGTLRVGAWADIVVFDPATVQDTSKFDDPHHYPVGLPHVIVNGVPVLVNGVMTGVNPGRAIRRGE